MTAAISPKALVGKDGFLFLGPADVTKLVEHLTGGEELSETARRIIRRNAATAGSLTVPYCGLIVPEAHIIYADKLPESFQLSDHRPVAECLTDFDQRTLYPLDLLRDLRASGIPVYTGNDSHWSELAAFRVYEDMRSRVGRTNPFNPVYRPSEIRELQDLRPLSHDEAEHRQQALKALAGSNFRVAYSNGILNYGAVTIYQNPGGKGRCLAFGTSFSRSLVPAYATDFAELVFCYGTAIDPVMVQLVEPDVVYTEIAERFVHFPSLAVPGSVLTGALIGMREPGYNLPARPIRQDLSSITTRFISILEDLGCPDFLSTRSYAIIREISRETAHRLEAAFRLAGRLDNIRHLRLLATGQYMTRSVLGYLQEAVDDGRISYGDRPILPDTEMGLILQVRLFRRTQDFADAARALDKLEAIGGETELSRQHREFLDKKGFPTQAPRGKTSAEGSAASHRTKVLYIHIGLHKTGSTYLQHVLNAKRNELSRSGIAYPSVPDPKGFGFQHADLAARIAAGEIEAVSDIVAKAFRWRDTVLLSSEEFYPLGSAHKENLRRLFAQLRELSHEIRVIAYLRRQDNAAQSVYRTSIKSDELTTQTFREYIESHTSFSDYWKNMQIWHELADTMIIRPYEKGQFADKDLLTDFLGVFGIENVADFQTKTESHPSLSAAVSEVIRRGNAERTTEDIWKFLEILKRAIPKEKLYDGGGASPYMSPDERKVFMAKFETGNALIAREWMGRPDGILFREPIPEKDERAKFTEGDIRELQTLVDLQMAREYGFRRGSGLISRLLRLFRLR